MTENSFINTIRSKARYLGSVLLQKSEHLMQELSNDPMGGFMWWLKTHKQKLAMDDAMSELLQHARKPDFQLDEVAVVFSKFQLKKDDAGQAQWYQDAHDKLLICQRQLEESSTLKLKMVEPALIELRFISEADQFHQYFQLQPLQRRVRDMYETITERLDILLEDTRNRQQLHKQEIEVRHKEAEVQQAAEKAKHSKHQLKKEKAALNKVKNERKLIDSQRDADEEAWKREEADRKLRIQESQQEQQQKLQDSFQTLNADATSLDLGALLKQIKNNEFDRNDPKTKELLQELLQAIGRL